MKLRPGLRSSQPVVWVPIIRVQSGQARAPSSSSYETVAIALAHLQVRQPRVAERRSQITRQSVWHWPWHLNSVPRPPILPPHSGQIQFKMPETTSVVLLTLLNLVNVILTSPIQVIALRSRIASWRSAFLVPNRKELAGRNCLAKMKPSSKARHQNRKWQFARSVSRLRSPASI